MRVPANPSTPDDSNTLNLKLFPSRPSPPPIHNWHVPLSLVAFPAITTSTWDLTVQRMLPHIDGINSVARIAVLADTDLTLSRRAVAHLLYYGCICLLDIFHFSAVYAPTAEIAVFFADEAMQDECRHYITSPFSPFDKHSLSAGISNKPLQPRTGSRLNPDHEPSPVASVKPPSRASVLELYSTLRQGVTLRDWCLTNNQKLAGVDIRRFITFGKIKGFLYRSHRYAVAQRPSEVRVDLDDPIQAARAQEKAWRKAAMSSGWQTPKGQKPPGNLRKTASKESMQTFKEGGACGGAGPGPGEDMQGLDDALGLGRYLDGLHCLDEVCTALKSSEREVVKKLKGVGDVAFFYR